MDVVEVLYRLGGVGSHRALVAATSRWHVRAAVEAGRVQRVGGGAYALPGVDDAVRAARALNGVVSVLSAAQHWRWPVWQPPAAPWVTVPRDRSPDPRRTRGARVIRQDVPCDGYATTPLQTALDCARRLPLHEAVAVADSALRSGLVRRHELIEAADRLPRPGKARQVAQLADARSDNPFESVIRAIASEVEGVRLVPQVDIPGYGRADLADVDRRLVIECDSFGFHAARADLLRDIERYNRAALLRVHLVRFGYEHGHRPDYVRSVLEDWLTLPPSRHTVPLPGSQIAA